MYRVKRQSFPMSQKFGDLHALIYSEWKVGSKQRCRLNCQGQLTPLPQTAKVRHESNMSIDDT